MTARIPFLGVAEVLKNECDLVARAWKWVGNVHEIVR